MTPQFSWAQVLEQWDLIRLDLHERFGIDCDEPGLLRSRRWSWLRLHIRSLLGENTRLDRALRPR